MSQINWFQLGAPVLILLSLGIHTPCFADNVRATNPNTASVEILGRAFLYSVNYDRAMGEDMAAGFGIGSSATKTQITHQDAHQSATFLPIYMNYYFEREAGSLFLTGGVVLITNHSDVESFETATGNYRFSSSPVVPQAGLGYENRSDAGFLFRLTGYATVGQVISGWAGFTFGYSF